MNEATSSLTRAGFDLVRSATDTLLPLATGSYLAVQFSSILGVPAVIHIARRVLIAERLR